MSNPFTFIQGFIPLMTLTAAGYGFAPLCGAMDTALPAPVSEVSPGCLQGPNDGFEIPILKPGEYKGAGNLPGFGWTCSGGVVLTTNKSGFSNRNQDIPQGNQACVLQNAASMEQTIHGFHIGRSYVVNMQAALRTDMGQNQMLEIFIDNISLGSYTADNNAFGDLTTKPFTATATSHALRIVGLNPTGGDNSIIIDAVRVVEASLMTTRTVAEWLKISRDETVQQKQWELDHPVEGSVLLGAGQFVTMDYCRVPDATWVVGTPEFIAWWKSTGVSGMEQWARDGFPLIIDRDHLIFNSLALSAAHNTPTTNPTLFIEGHAFDHPERFWRYLDRIKLAGVEVTRRGCSGQSLSQRQYDTLRLYGALVYSIWGAPYLPYDLKLTPGSNDGCPIPGMTAPDFHLMRLESVLKSPRYTDDNSFDFRRPFHSEIAAFLLEVCNGYEAVPKADRIPDGPVVRMKPFQSSDPDLISLTMSRGKKAALILLSDPIDGYWQSAVPLLEPLYQATKDRIDWHFVCDDIDDNVFWSDTYFPPYKGQNRAFQKAVSMEERGQLGKMLLMRYVNLSIPVLLDDMAQTTQNTYADGGGIAKAVLIDRTGKVSFHSRSVPEYNETGPWCYQSVIKHQCIISANIRALLDHDATWDGKPPVIPDWLPSPNLDNAKVTAIDTRTGLLTVAGSDGKTQAVTIDPGTRIIFSSANSNVRKSISDLNVGNTISLLYEPSGPGNTPMARLIVVGMSTKDFLSPSTGAGIGVDIWCPAVTTALTRSTITAVLAPRSKADLLGLKFWEEAGDPGIFWGPSWLLKVDHDWIDHPQQVLTLSVDRATDVIVNGMKGKLSDIRVGDHLGVEFRPDQSGDNLWPYFIFVYQYHPPEQERGSSGR